MAYAVIFLYVVVEDRPNKAISLELDVTGPRILWGEELVSIVKPSCLWDTTNCIINYSGQNRIIRNNNLHPMSLCLVVIIKVYVLLILEIIVMTNLIAND